MSALLTEVGFDVLSASTQEAFADCAIVEVSDVESFNLLGAVIESYPNLPVVAVVDELDITVASRALATGAHTAILESASAEQIEGAVRAAMRDETLLPQPLALSIAHHVPSSDDVSQWINDAEIGWLRHMAGGLTVSDLAAEVGYSERAMFRQLKALYHRLGVNNRTEALLWAKQRRLLD